jgi:hypothetical protein
MDSDMVRTGLDEIGDVALGLHNHQVAIERQPNRAAQRSHNRHSKADAWDEHTVHYIDLEPIGTGGLGVECLLAQPREVSGQHGRG